MNTERRDNQHYHNWATAYIRLRMCKVTFSPDTYRILFAVRDGFSAK